MRDVVDAVNQAVRDCQDIEASSFYRDYQKFSKEYDSLIQEGITRRRESQLKTIFDPNEVSPFSYNLSK
jgi:hypothetical protein